MSLRNYQKNIIKILDEETRKIVMIEKDRGVGVTYTFKEYVKKEGSNRSNINILYVGSNMIDSFNFVDSSYIRLDRRPVFHFSNGSRLFLTSYSNIMDYARGRYFDLIIFDNVENIISSNTDAFGNMFDVFFPTLSAEDSKIIITFNYPLYHSIHFHHLISSASRGNITYMYVSESLITNNI